MANENQLTITNVRLSFPKLFKAESIGGGAPRYSCSLLIDKGDPQLKKINSLLKGIVDEKFGGKLASDKLPIRDGADRDYDGYENAYYLSCARSEASGRPTIVDRDKSPLTAEDGKPYGGCYVNAVVRFYSQNGKGDKPNDYGKRINCSLEIVQFYKDGEPFGAPKASLDALPDEESLDDNDDLA